MYKKYIQNIIIAFSIFGCTSDPHMLSVEDEFSKEEEQVILESINEWMFATCSSDATIFVAFGYPSHHEFSYDDYKNEDDGPVLHKIYSYESGYGDIVKVGGGNFNGCTFKSGGGNIILVADHIKTLDYFKFILLHELGHFLGLEHYNQGLMRSVSIGESCIDQYTLNKFCEEFNSCCSSAAPTCK